MVFLHTVLPRTPTLLWLLLLWQPDIPLSHCQSYEAELRKIFVRWWSEWLLPLGSGCSTRRNTLRPVGLPRHSDLFRLYCVQCLQNELNNRVGLERSKSDNLTSSCNNDPEDRRFKNNHGFWNNAAYILLNYKTTVTTLLPINCIKNTPSRNERYLNNRYIENYGSYRSFCSCSYLSSKRMCP